MTALSWIGSLWSALSNITGPMYVWINSKMDDRYTIAVGGFMCVLGLMLASITNEVRIIAILLEHFHSPIM